MKFTKRIVALILCALMLVTVAPIVNAATVSMTVKSSFNVKTGVAYAKYSVYGSQSKHTETCTVLEFSPDQYIPVPFVGYAGSADLLATQYNRAVNAYGFEVAGIINGSFFGTANDALIGHIITNGRLTCAHFNDPQEMVTFDSNGKMSFVSSTLGCTLNSNGKITTGGVAYVNKRMDAAWSGNADKIFYFDDACGTVIDSTGSNYEVLCKKVNNTEMAVGNTLEGEVIAVYSSKNKTNVSKGQFVLSVKMTSSYAEYVKDLQAGQRITLDVTEQNAAARASMESANGAITNVGILVKDGVDLTLTQSSVGTHSVTGTYARWTAFGTKPDGSYVFFTSEGGGTGVSSRSLTLRDVAAAMIKLGCNNVVRMDGGGSTAMYVSNTGSGSPGYVMSHSREVCDCILIVKKSSMVNADLVTALRNAVAEAKEYISIVSDPEISKAITEAEAALNKGNVVAGDAIDFIARLSISSKSKLKDLMDKTKALSYNSYSEEQLSVIRAVYQRAEEVYNNDSATTADVVKAFVALRSCTEISGKTVISKGKSYTTTGAKHGSYPDDGVRLTDGAKSETDGGSVASYSGWDAYTTAEIIVDLGASAKSNTYTLYGAYGFYGILPPTAFEVFVSNDGKSFTSVGSSTEVVPVGVGKEMSDGIVNMYKYTVTAANDQTARYVKFKINPKNFVWVDEVEVAITENVQLSVSSGKKYTTSGEKHGTFYDNGVRLTDGKYSSPDGGSVEYYSGWGNGANAVVTVDLGYVMNTDVYTVYGAYGFYGIDAPVSMKVEVSENGTSFTQVGSTSTLISKGKGSSLEDGTTTLYAFTVKTDKLNSARYVRFTVTPSDFIWIDEVEVAVSDMMSLKKVGAAVGVFGFNQYVYDSNCFIYTPDFGTLTADKINHRYTTNVILTKTSDPNVYVIKSIQTNKGTAANITLASNEIMIACHSGRTAQSVIGQTILSTAEVGKKVTFYGVDFAKKTVGPMAYAAVEGIEEVADLNIGDVNEDGNIDQYDYILVKRHYFGTRILSDAEKLRADVNNDTKVDQYDYILICRHYFGTYKIG